MPETDANNGNDLKAGFSDRVHLSSDAGGQTASMSTTLRQVRFSEDVRTQLFQPPSKEELSRRWHSKRERFFLRQDMRRDVQDMRSLLSSTPMESLEKDVLYLCVGLDGVLSNHVMIYLKEKKRHHSRSIVAMQDRFNDEQLSEYAISSSSPSRERAQQLASNYWEILSQRT